MIRGIDEVRERCVELALQARLEFAGEIVALAKEIETYICRNADNPAWSDSSDMGWTTVRGMTAHEVEQRAKRAADREEYIFSNPIKGDMSARPLWTQDGTVALVTREAIRRMFEIPDDVRVYVEADDAITPEA